MLWEESLWIVAVLIGLNERYPLMTTPDKAYHDIVYADLGQEAFLYKSCCENIARFRWMYVSI